MDPGAGHDDFLPPDRLPPPAGRGLVPVRIMHASGAEAAERVERDHIDHPRSVVGALTWYFSAAPWVGGEVSWQAAGSVGSAATAWGTARGSLRENVTAGIVAPGVRRCAEVHVVGDDPGLAVNPVSGIQRIRGRYPEPPLRRLPLLEFVEHLPEARRREFDPPGGHRRRGPVVAGSRAYQAAAERTLLFRCAATSPGAGQDRGRPPPSCS